jgi:hypothetical protein
MMDDSIKQLEKIKHCSVSWDQAKTGTSIFSLSDNDLDP